MRTKRLGGILGVHPQIDVAAGVGAELEIKRASLANGLDCRRQVLLRVGDGGRACRDKHGCNRQGGVRRAGSFHRGGL